MFLNRSQNYIREVDKSRGNAEINLSEIVIYMNYELKFNICTI